jgi:uncharacterized protein YbcI
MDGSARERLANSIVGWYSERYGRGPTRTRVYVEDDHVLIILGNVQTAAERTLTSRGHGDLVKQVRRTVKVLFRDQLATLVEEATSRKVIAVHSDHDPATNTAVYVFLFESQG